MIPYAELLEFNQPNPIRKPGFTRIRDQFQGLKASRAVPPFRFPDPERIMEFAGRWDYGASNATKLGEKSKMLVDGQSIDVPIIEKYIGMGHESMIEMGDATFFIECSRVVSHELVRHRLVSYQQESQRFVKYDNLAEWDEAMFYPDGTKDVKINPSDYSDDNAMEMMYRAYKDAYFTYQRLRAEGVAPQIARYVLPNAMRTRLIMKTNAREWRHILKLRTDKSAQPEMRELMLQVYDQLTDIFPNAMKGILEGERTVR